MNKKKVIVIGLFISFIILIIGFSFLDKKIDFKRCFVKFFELGDIDYEFPSPSKYTYNISGLDEIISFTTNREYFLTDVGKTTKYKDFDGKSEINVQIINNDKDDASIFYNSINNDTELIKNVLDNGMKYAESTSNGKFYIYIIYSSGDVAYIFTFSCDNFLKEEFVSDFREYANSIKVSSL